MDFRIRPSSKKSTDFDRVSDRSLVELPMPKSFQSNDMIMKSLSNRIQNLESSFSHQQDIWRKQRQISNAGYLDVQKKIDFLEYKMFSNEKDIKQLNQLQPFKETEPTDNAKAFAQNEINLMKQAINHERQTHRQYTKHQKQLYEQMGRRQLKLQQQIRELLNEQKSEYHYQMKGQIEEIRTSQMVKQKKIEQQYEMMKNVIANSEKKIFDEFERKLRNETVIKDYIEDKLLELKEEISIDQKGILTKENKFVKEIKESIESVMLIIQNLRKDFEEELAETQKLSATNIKRLSMSIDLIKEKLDERTKHLTSENNSIQNEIVQFRTFMTSKLEENRELILEIQEENHHVSASRTKSRRGESSGGQEQGESNGSLKKMQSQMNNWKAITEQKNLNVFRQISTTLKTMKMEWKKENDEMSSEVGSFKESLFNVKKSVPLEIKKSVQAIITVFNNEFDTLAEELDTLMEMIALAKKENEKYVQDQLKKISNDILTKVKEMISASQKQANIYTEKSITKHDQSLKNHVEIQSKFLKDMMVQKHAGLENEIGQAISSSKKTNLNTNNQLEDFTVKLKTFNEKYKDYLEEQRKDDMKKRLELEETMRKNSSNLMDICYKKCEFLVEGMKKAMQMNQLKDKVDLTREVQFLREDSEKKIFQTKQDMTTDMNEKLDKMAEERQSSEEALQETLDQQIATLKRTFQLELQGTKQQLESTKQQLEVTKQNLDKSQKDVEASKQRLEENKKQLQQNKKEYEESRKELQERLNEIKDKGHESTEQLENTVNTLRETMWKMEAMSFSEQAKNKAIFDRLGEDLAEVSTNMSSMATEMRGKK